MSTPQIPSPPEDPVALLRHDDRGLVPAVVQDATSGRVLMLAWMDDEALRRTLSSRQGTYWSRSRQEYWVKGATSGHTQRVRTVELDCDGDTLLVRVDQTGPACHTGAASCLDTHLLLAEPGAERSPERPAATSVQPSVEPAGRPGSGSAPGEQHTPAARQ